MSVIIYNNPQSNTWRGRYTTFNHGHHSNMVIIVFMNVIVFFFNYRQHFHDQYSQELIYARNMEGIVLNCISLSLSSLLPLFSSPLIYISLSLLVHPLRLSLSLSCLASLLFNCSISLCPTQLKFYSWIYHNGSSKRKMKSWKWVLHYVTHKHTYHLIRQSDEFKSSYCWYCIILFHNFALPKGQTNSKIRSLSYWGAKCWNTILQELKTIENKNVFRKHIKSPPR